MQSLHQISISGDNDVTAAITQPPFLDVGHMDPQEKRFDPLELSKGAEQAEASRRLRLPLWLMIGVTAATFLAAAYALQQRYDAILKAGAAQKLAEEETRRRKIAESAKSRADAQARIAVSPLLAALSRLERDRHLDLALLLAVEAHDAATTKEARNGLFGALTARPGLSAFLHSTRGEVDNVAFSPDGKTLAAGCARSGVAGVLLRDTSRHARIPDQHVGVSEGYVHSLSFSPDGTTLAAGYGRGEVGGVVLWDAARRARVQDLPLPVQEGDVWSVAFSPDGNTLAAGYRVGDDGGVVLWDVDLASWRRHAGSISNRNFSRAEWQEYFPSVPYRKTFDWLPEAPVTE
jgi:WD domain, G-beta repeat/WD40-like Beta Propeller Repeat